MPNKGEKLTPEKSKDWQLIPADELIYDKKVREKQNPVVPPKTALECAFEKASEES